MSVTPLAATPTVDAVSLGLVRGSLMASIEELGSLIARTSMSPFINEKHDYLVGFATASGQFVALDSPTMAGINLVRPVLEQYDEAEIRAGDLYWFNDAYLTRGTITHSPDMVFVAPAFLGEDLIGYCACFGHFWDIGGLRPGSLSADAREIFHEGFLVPPVRIVKQGVWNDELFRTILRNSRFPEFMEGDVRALTAATHLGVERLRELANRFGRDTTVEACEQLVEQSAQILRRQLCEKVPNGTTRFGDRVDGDSSSDRASPIRLQLKRDGDTFVLDTSESGDQAAGPINLLMDDSIPMVILAQALAVDDRSVLLNGGANALLDEVIKRSGSLLAPRFPAPLGSRGVTLRVLGAALQGLLAIATGGQCAAASPAYGIYVLRTVDQDSGRAVLCTDGLAVGRGGRPDSDGPDAIYATAQQNFPCEYMESTFPVRMEEYAIHRDSGGAGLHRGGCGVVRQFRFIGERAELAVRLGNTQYPSWGVNGGKSANPGSAVVNPGTKDERVLAPMSDGNTLTCGDVVRIATTGGGGWGHPFDRDPMAVLSDVLDGFVSEEAALRDYGVALTLSGDDVDPVETKTVRTRQRPAVKMFHRGKYLDDMW